MFYRIFIHAGETRFFTEVRSCSKIPYITVKEMKKRYSGKNFVIIGEIGSISGASENVDWLYVEEGKVIPILPRGSLKRPFERVIGYTQVDEKSFVAVVGGFLHILMRMRCILKGKRE